MPTLLFIVLFCLMSFFLYQKYQQQSTFSLAYDLFFLYTFVVLYWFSCLDLFVNKTADYAQTILYLISGYNIHMNNMTSLNNYFASNNVFEVGKALLKGLSNEQ